MGDNISAWNLFIINEWGGIVTYAASIFFGIFAIFSLAFNAINLGMVGAMFSSFKANGGLQFIIYLIPHGIFELTATVGDKPVRVSCAGFAFDSAEAKAILESFKVK